MRPPPGGRCHFGGPLSLAADEIAALVAELRPLQGSRVDAVRGLAERALAISLRGTAGPSWILVLAEADLTRLHALSARPPAPRAPPPFQARITDIVIRPA